MNSAERRRRRWLAALVVSGVVHLVLVLPLVDPRSAVASEDEPEGEQLLLVELAEPVDKQLAIDEADVVVDSAEPELPEEAAEAVPDLLEDEAEQSEQEERPEERAPDELDRDDSRTRQHVRYREDEQESEHRPRSPRIASKDIEALEETRAPKRHPLLGKETDADLGAQGSAGAAAQQPVKAPRSDERAAQSQERAEERALIERPTPQEKRRSAGLDQGAPADPGAAAGPSQLAERAGGQDGSESSGVGARAPQPGSAGAPAVSQQGSEESAPLADEGWEPFALRVEPSAGRTAPTLAPSEEQTQPRDDEQATIAKAPTQPRETGAEGAATQRALQPRPEAQDEAPAVAELQEQEGERREKTSPGWGGEQALSSQTQASTSGSLSFTGAPATSSPEVAELEVKLGDETRLSARKHEFGAYYDELHDALRERWVELTPLEVRALGYQGSSVVRITVDGKGRVQDKQLVKRSGYSELDAIAMAAVPKRVGRPPQGLAEPTFTYEMNFRMTDRWGE